MVSRRLGVTGVPLGDERGGGYSCGDLGYIYGFNFVIMGESGTKSMIFLVMNQICELMVAVVRKGKEVVAELMVVVELMNLGMVCKYWNEE
ncbi:hypothetical protein HanRHA438_Chr05g0237071 [Helianthus annuus]|nr:hypothetical protein HanRHA438_Chr05g0237071 [Helianthus annuus]